MIKNKVVIMMMPVTLGTNERIFYPDSFMLFILFYALRFNEDFLLFMWYLFRDQFVKLFRSFFIILPYAANL